MIHSRSNSLSIGLDGASRTLEFRKMKDFSLRGTIARGSVGAANVCIFIDRPIVSQQRPLFLDALVLLVVMRM